MELVKDKDLDGIYLDIINEYLTEDDGFRLVLRVRNIKDKKQKTQLTIKYISVEKGTLEECEPLGFDGIILQSNAFVDANIDLEGLTGVHDGDRMEIIVNEGKNARLLLIRENNLWYVLEHKNIKTYNETLKRKFEHFETIDEQFGLTLQNFSVKVKDEYYLEIYCEVLALNGTLPAEPFNIELAIYDSNNNIVYWNSLSKSKGSFKGFEIFAFNVELDIPIDEIGKIRFYPTK